MTREKIKEKAIEKADEILIILGRGPGKGKVLDYGEENVAAYNDLIEIARSVGMEITNETAISTMFCVEVMRRLVRSGTTERIHLLNHIDNLEERLKKRDWIPVSGRLPEESLNSVIGWDAYRARPVFVQCINGYFCNIGSNESFDIKAWMPLPEPYKESEETNESKHLRNAT